MKKYELTIDNMKCQGCVSRVSNLLSKIEGVNSYEISLERKSLIIEVDSDKILKEVVKKIENLDFQVILNK